MSAVPFTIGRYTVFSELASGGQASVHLGRFTGPAGFSRAVAIKRIRSDLAKDERARAMMLDEARLASRVQHPNVVQTLDVVWNDGELVLVMELVQGESLVRLLRASGGVIPAPVVVSIVSQALRGLHAAHRATDADGRPLGLIHRDLSPQNVIVDVHGVAKVLDFGVAKARGRSQEDTDVGTLKGKLSYMAPEQIHGESDQRSDLWAMGVVLWECLAGAKLFVGESDGAVVGKLLSMPIPSLATKGLDPQLEAVVTKALARDLPQRFTSAEEMADALDRCGAASTSQVAKWVMETASEAIERTKQRVRELESDPQLAQALPAPSGRPVRTERSREPLEPSRSSWPVVGAVLGAVVLLVAVGGVWWTRGAASAPAPPVDQGSVVAEPAAPLVPPSEPPPVVEQPAEVAPPEPAPVVARPKPRPKPKPSGKKPGCEPPYTVLNGVKQWKPECF